SQNRAGNIRQRLSRGEEVIAIRVDIELHIARIGPSERGDVITINGYRVHGSGADIGDDPARAARATVIVSSDCDQSIDTRAGVESEDGIEITTVSIDADRSAVWGSPAKPNRTATRIIDDQWLIRLACGAIRVGHRTGDGIRQE